MSIVTAPDADTLAQLLALEHRRRHALITVDIAALDELFDPHLVHIHAPGVTHTKAQLLEHVATRAAYLEITRGDLNIRIIDDVAIMTGLLTNRLRTHDGGERTLGGVVTQVAHRDTEGTWRFISFQMTPLGEEAWPALPSQQEAQHENAAEQSAPSGNQDQQ
ncbi:nuclear transport factor 2 family protein [Leifsonia sp. A12D58]|uniref:nuclear transport factor 2 family protein n=1 Tax=Leifsonia sp. A12D58 TaxID=3397674 RepID=UPI0039E0C433